MSETIGIQGAACVFPSRTLTLDEVFAEEDVALDDELVTRLGIEHIADARSEKGSDLAAQAGREALQKAGIESTDLGVILDCTTQPQEFLAPAWNMSNKVQHALGAKNAFTVGLSGAGATSLLVAIDFASSLISTDDSIASALIVAAETAIRGRRILDRDDPVTVFGDGAGALVLQRGGEGPGVLSTALSTDGSRHDACYIPGGAMKHPLRGDLYAPTLDRAAYDEARGGGRVRALAETLCAAVDTDLGSIASAVLPNLSAEADAAFAAALGVSPATAASGHRRARGHLHAVDLVLNWAAALDAADPGDVVLFGSHGMGHTAGAALVRC